MGNLSFIENMLNNKLKNLHTAYIARILSTNGTTAKVQPLGKVKAYGETAISQSPISNVPILNSARFKISTKKIEFVSDVDINTKNTKKDISGTEIEYVSEATADTNKKSETVLTATPIAAGDIVLCVCCERDITEAKKGVNATPAIGHHSMSDSVIVGIL